jgi:oxygen-independent coproporphyrinogen III oxidase
LDQTVVIVAPAGALHLSQIKSDTVTFGTVPHMNAQALALSDSPPSPDITQDIIRRLDVQGPRYTSYPTADRFVEAFGPAQYAQALQQRACGVGAIGGAAAPLSVYVHIPFCESVCYYCACNKVVTRRKERAEDYLNDLFLEIGLHEAVLGTGQSLSQLHLGGGTPTYFTDEQIERLLMKLQSVFRFVPGGEYSIEVDPRTVDAERLSRLWAMGFNRISLGVQDFDPAVQQAVHRVQPFEQVASLTRTAREVGFESINMDLIYGLPRQTPESFARTLSQVSELRPERIALYAYAHLPQRFKPQRRIDARLLPPAPDKVGMLAAAITQFRAAGYAYIGMDHFALPTDPLAMAKRQGRLHRNFQGYSTHADSDLVALGVSAIGRIGPHYSQNAKTVDDYHDALSRGEFPIQRGLSLSRDDMVRRAVIMAIMCQGRVDIESIELAWLIDFRQYFGREIDQLEPLTEKGLVVMEPDGIRVTPLGWYFVRAIAMVFDRHLQADKAVERFSRII